MRYLDILREYDEKKTVANYGTALQERYSEETGGEIPPETILWKLSQSDPTPKKAYLLDLVRWYLSGSMKRIEDAAKAHGPFELYAKFKNRGLPPLKSLTFDQFLDLGDELAGQKSRTEVAKDEEENFYKNGEAILLKDTPTCKIIQLNSVEASKFFGRNTRWCTASDRDNMFKEYRDEGPIYDIIFKGRGNSKWQFHFESGQFMDEKDRVLEPHMVAEEPDVESYFRNKFADQGEVAYVADPDSLSMKQKLFAVKNNGPDIQYFEKPTEDMVKAAVRDGRLAWPVLPYEYQAREDIQMLGLESIASTERYFSYPHPSEAVTAFMEQRLKRFFQLLAGKLIGGSARGGPDAPLISFCSNQRNSARYAYEHHLAPESIMPLLKKYMR